jgi:hypothetical protein
MSETRAEQIERLEEMRKSALSMAGFRRGNDPEAEKQWRADAEALEAGAAALEREERMKEWIRNRQDKKGIGAIMGKWPGDESDEEIERALREIS